MKCHFVLFSLIAFMYQSIVLKKYGHAEDSFEIQDFTLSEPGFQELTIQTEYSGLNYADVMARRGLYGAAPKPPCVLGYDLVGKVTKVGVGGDESLIEKRVLAFTRFGGYASHVNVHQNNIILIPDRLDGAAATALATQYATAYYAVHLRSHILPGELVLQHAAAGGVGLAIFQMVTNLGGICIGITSNEEKKSHLISMGMPHVINRNKEDYAAYIRANFPVGVQWIYNSVAGKSFKNDLKLLSTGGHILLYGAAERLRSGANFFGTIQLLWQMGLILPIKLMIQSTGVTGINMLTIGDKRPELLRFCMEKVMEMFQKNQLHPLAKSYSVSDVAQAHAELESGNSMGKIALKWG